MDDAPDTPPTKDPDDRGDVAPGADDGGDAVVHLYVLLDRSGSMAAMADEVIAGFNQLLADQVADGDDARMTLVQFDGVEPQHVVADAVPITEMTPLDATTFVPRGATPLLDATGILLGRATSREAARASAGLSGEQVVVVSITDGHENSSSEFSLSAVRRLVEERTAGGWQFVFLGAALDVYGEAGGMGYRHGSTQSFAPDGTGARAAFASLSTGTSELRGKVRRGARASEEDFFADKPAEADRRRRRRG